jgi:hypothetical protein
MNEGILRLCVNNSKKQNNFLTGEERARERLSGIICFSNSKRD